jgi:hypothetical protein
MNKRLTAKKKKFLDNYVITHSVTEASKAAGYTQPGSCYRLVAKDKHGVYVDETVRLYLSRMHGLAPPTPEPPKALIMIPPPPPMRLASVVPFPHQTPEEMESPTIESVHGLLWRLAQDDTMTGGSRVAAAVALLKDLRDQPVDVDIEPEDLIADLRIALNIEAVSV